MRYMCITVYTHIDLISLVPLLEKLHQNLLREVTQSSQIVGGHRIRQQQLHGCVIIIWSELNVHCA